MAISQKTVTVYADTTGYISSTNATYSTARSGGTLSANTSVLQSGQRDFGGYSCYEGFLTFDTSDIPAAATIDAVTLSVAIETDFSTTDFTLRARTPWTPALTTGDWIAGASLSAKTLLASKSTSGLSTNTYYALTSEAAFASNVTKEGTTTVILSSSRHEAGTTSDPGEYLLLHNAASAYPPKLIVVYTSEDNYEDEQSIVARPFTTRAAAAEAIARAGGDGDIIDWWYEPVGSTIVAHAEIRPTTVAGVPRNRWYVVSRDTPGVSVDVAYDSEDTPDYAAVIYRTLGDVTYPDGTYRTAYYPSTPTSAIARVELLNLSGSYMTSGAATAYAQQYMAREAAGAMSARVTAVGGLRTVDGLLMPAALICAGDWISVADVIPHTEMPAFITGTTYDSDTDTVTITTGGREQAELVVPGVSALPGQLAAYYGYQAAQQTEVWTDSGGGGDDGDDVVPPEIDDTHGLGYVADPVITGEGFVIPEFTPETQ